MLPRGMCERTSCPRKLPLGSSSRKPSFRDSATIVVEIAAISQEARQFDFPGLAWKTGKNIFLFRGLGNWWPGANRTTDTRIFRPRPVVLGVCLINHLQRLPAPSPGTPRHNYGTPNLSSSHSWHIRIYGLIATILPLPRRIRICPGLSARCVEIHLLSNRRRR
jgi:hypothetical protein